TRQVQAFLASETSAKEVPFEADWGLKLDSPGRQIFPGHHGMDGFFYCLLEKA
ncbi:MAG: 16S rRNA (cytosine(967)-C(5))-methyltransferase RsmB, partial [Gammaproteobacteria bacterium]|nr:16S rRNA (cytosine(967)-C(5))-methyltransferase RsmB [Gammaproteobacteria bacterium]